MGRGGFEPPKQIAADLQSVPFGQDVYKRQRPYKKPLSVSYAVSELKKNSGTQFDPELVNVFIRLINEGKITV